MTVASFYRRPLPEPAIAFSSPEGRAIFKEALAAGTMEGWFPLAEQFHTQTEPAFCGLGSLVMVLNALAIDPRREWRGPWRWFGEELLDCCRSLDIVREKGVTLAQLACLASCNGARAEVRRPGEDRGMLGALREAVMHAATTPDEPHLIVGYDRAALGQTGQGHYSPVAGLHRERDLVLVLDVARFKYPPHWIALETLHTAMSHIDPESGRARGWVELSRSGAPPITEALEQAVGILPSELDERLHAMFVACKATGP